MKNLTALVTTIMGNGNERFAALALGKYLANYQNNKVNSREMITELVPLIHAHELGNLNSGMQGSENLQPQQQELLQILLRSNRTMDFTIKWCEVKLNVNLDFFRTMAQHWSTFPGCTHRASLLAKRSADLVNLVRLSESDSRRGALRLLMIQDGLFGLDKHQLGKVFYWYFVNVAMKSDPSLWVYDFIDG